MVQYAEATWGLQWGKKQRSSDCGYSQWREDSGTFTGSHFSHEQTATTGGLRRSEEV